MKIQKSAKSFLKNNVLNVKNYLSTPREFSIKWYLLDYLSKNRHCRFKNQKEIAECLRNKYGLSEESCKQGSISKAIRNVNGYLQFDKRGYYTFSKYDGVYMLRSYNDIENESWANLFLLEDAFVSEKVHLIGENTVVFNVTEDKSEKVKELFENYLSFGVLFGIMVNNGFLVLMLDDKHIRFESVKLRLTRFFTERADAIERIKTKERIRKKDAEIRKKQKLKGNYELSTHSVSKF